ncbi:hypothetical protein RHS04_00472 [Rhizoctonia solani]|uniref:Uncharacterized protein n=1 Tax=Rhizoctonia solani TaxID=456999 RepID=A0A8H7LMT3_9AGAM|nr:hypothetical protein RHS04_00472 [Rhizoctonia solani]
MSSFPYTPFPFNVTPESPLFELSSIALDVSEGWVPSCSSPDCVPTARWSTSSVGAALSLYFWGWDVALEGNIKGDMDIEIFRDGTRLPWSPFGGTLASIRGGATDQSYLHNVTLKVINASSEAELTVTQARVDGSSFGDFILNADRWIVPSDDTRLSYTGFTQHAGAAKAGSSTTYISSKSRRQTSTFLIHGPCGPANGLIKLSIDGRESTLNTSEPIASNDCLLFQAWGFPALKEHDLLIENMGGMLGIDRLEFFWLDMFGERNSRSNADKKNVTIGVGIMIGILLVVAGLTIYFENSSKRFGRAYKVFCS